MTLQFPPPLHQPKSHNMHPFMSVICITFCHIVFMFVVILFLHRYYNKLMYNIILHCDRHKNGNNDVFKLIYILTLDTLLGTVNCLQSSASNSLLLEITVFGLPRSVQEDTDRPRLAAETFLFAQCPNCKRKRYHIYDYHPEMYYTVFSTLRQDEILLFSQPR